MTVKKKFTLGRGLDALISTEEVSTSGSSSINEVELDKICANPNQPRREFNQEALQELADSIKEIGIIQPITLRSMEDESYQIIAGERRYRASILAGMKTIPAYIKTADDENVMEMALIENIQREDLNSLEIALAYQHLLEQYNLTQERLSDRVGKKRTTVANYLRLLKLPAPIQVALKNKEIDMGHARSLLALTSPKDQIQLFNDIKKNNYSVRKVEELIKAILNKADSKSHHPTSFTGNAATFDIYKKRISNCLGVPIKISYNNDGKGKISIPFANEAELQKIVTLLENIKQS